MMLQPEWFDDLARRLSLPDFDVMVVTDGSGTVASKPCGWAALTYYRNTGETLMIPGGAGTGSVNYSELAPCVHALYHVQAKYEGRPVRVQFVSDSEVTVRCGQRVYARRALAALWAVVDWFENAGYQIGWSWVQRNTNPLNTMADGIAKAVRLMMRQATECELDVVDNEAKGGAKPRRKPRGVRGGVAGGGGPTVRSPEGGDDAGGGSQESGGLQEERGAAAPVGGGGLV